MTLERLDGPAVAAAGLGALLITLGVILRRIDARLGQYAGAE